MGFSERVRGHFQEVYSGTHLLTSGVAVRFPILPLHYYSMPSVLLPEASTSNLKFGINGAFFADAGIVWERKYQLATNNMISGFGTALHILLPYVEVARMELAFDLELNSQVIFEVRTTF